MPFERQGEWLHEASVMQALLEGVNQHSMFLTVYPITLCSAKPLQHHHVKQALIHLFRKLPHLRLCFKRRDNRLWVCNMDHEEIDFQVVDGKETVEVAEELGRQHKYNVSEGPLWCARLLTNEKNIINPRDEIKSAFPYNCSLLLGNHHGIADGTSNVSTLEFLQQILNDVIEGKYIDDSKQMGEYRSASELDELIDAEDRELEKDPARLEVLLKDFNGELTEPLLYRVLPPIHGVPYKTKYIHTVLDTDTTSRFIALCKDNGITVNCGFIAVLNVTLMEYMREREVYQKEYPIKTQHAVSVRRYLPKDISDTLGAHISLLVNTFMVPANWQECFWDYAKKVNQQFKKELQIEPIRYLTLVRKMFPNNNGFAETYSKPHTPHVDYIAATMGNADTRITTEGDHVRIGHFVRFSTNAIDPIMHLYHTFRGRFSYSLSYSVNLLSTETAQHLHDMVVKNLNKVL